jgi:hypothetical protein
MTIQQYLDSHHMSRRQLLALLRASGWAASDSSICRWIKGERRPSRAAMICLFLVSDGEITRASDVTGDSNG